MTTTYDLVIIGGGPGGYVAAIRASQLGLKTCLVEKEKLGGTCLHAGCIPSKALLRSAEVFATVKRAQEFGVQVGQVALDFPRVQARKQEIIDRLHKGILHLMKKGKIDLVSGRGEIISADQVRVTMADGNNQDLTAKHILLATGSSPRTLPGLAIDGEYVLTSDQALQLTELPESMLIVGGGVIGIEWASLLSDFGVDVTVLEYTERIIPTEDEDISKEMQRLLKKKRVKVVTGANVLSETLERGDGSVTIQAEHKGEKKEYTANKLLVSVGRAANVEGIGLETTNIMVERGFIETNAYFQTATPSIYAIGDVVGGLQLAHVASAEGIIAVEHMVGKQPKPLDETLVPRCIYSNPEVASVGYTEQEAKQLGYAVKTGKFSFRAIGKALVYGEVDGMVKLVVDEKTDALLGAHMIGPHVTDMISEAGLARVLEASCAQMGNMIHPHPALSETLGEAALDVHGLAIHA